LSGAQVRAADVLLRSVGGRAVLLRMPTPAVAGDDGEQVGLAQPSFQDVDLGPVVFRKVHATITANEVSYELLISATAVAKLVGSLAYESALVLFKEALGVLVDGTLLQINAATDAEAFGEAYLYRLKVHGAAALVA
jgi:hypothetical protein